MRLNKCSIPGCSNDSKSIKVYPPPVNSPSILAEWKRACPFLHDGNISKARICEKHFPRGNLDDKMRLDPSAVPSLHLPTTEDADSDCAVLVTGSWHTLDKSDNDAALQPKESQLKKCVLCDKCEDSTDPSTTLTKFPTDIKICRAWVKFVGIRSLAEKTSDKLHETTYLCLKHFAPGSYDKGVVRPQRIPTKNLPYLPLGEGVLEPNFGAINAPNKCAKVDKQQYESDKSEVEDCYEADIDDELVDKDKTTDADGIHTLFISYASTFRRLSTKLQIMLRLDLAKLFARYEIKNTEFIEARKIEKEKLIQEKRKERLKLFQNTVMTKSKGPPKTFSRKKKNFTVTNTSSQTDACEKAVDPMLCSLKFKDSTQLNSAVDPVAAVSVSTSSSTKVSSSGPMLTVMPLASTQKQIPKFSIGVTEAATTPDDSIISNKTTLTPIQFSDKKFKVVKVVKPSQIRSQISAKILTQVNKDVVSQVPASINSLLKRKVANLSGTPMSLLKPVKILRSQIVPPKDPLHISDNEAEDDSCVKFDGSTVDSVVKTEELDEDIS